MPSPLRVWLAFIGVAVATVSFSAAPVPEQPQVARVNPLIAAFEGGFRLQDSRGGMILGTLGFPFLFMSAWSGVPVARLPEIQAAWKNTYDPAVLRQFVADAGANCGAVLELLRKCAEGESSRLPNSPQV